MVRADEKQYTESFDEQFLDVDFYRLHKEFLPFVGKAYAQQKHKVLIIGESHYVCTKWNWDERVLFEEWWRGDWHERLMPEGDPHFDEWFNTRIHTSRGAGGEQTISQVVQNPLEYVAELFGEPYSSQMLERISFMNFFQFPSVKYGAGIWKAFCEKTKDIRPYKERRALRDAIWAKLYEESKRVVDEVIKILDPDLVIICSCLAGGAYCEGKESIDKPFIRFTTHSTWQPWKSAHNRFKISGEARCKQIIQEYLSSKA